MSDSKRQVNSGVYVWRNKVTGKVYVGSSIQISRRKTEHSNRLSKGINHGNVYFQRAWDKYGAENFEFEILEECSESNRLECEQNWIDRLRATDEQFGYNLIPTRTSQLYGAEMSQFQKEGWAKHSKEKRREINAHLFKPEIRQQALELANEAKKGQKWRDNMTPTWDKLGQKWQDPEYRKRIITAQNAGKAKSQKYKAYMARGRQRDSLTSSEAKATDAPDKEPG